MSMSAPSILAVAINPCNLDLLVGFLRDAGYRPLSADSVESFGKRLTDAEDIGLALVDLSGFGRGIWACCDRLQARSIPLIVIASQDVFGAAQREAPLHGAESILTKPLSVKGLLDIVRARLGVPT